MIEKITNNFWWKFLSLGLAFLLWLIVVNVEDPQTTRVFYDIQVKKMNADIIESEKKAIEYREGETVTIKIRGKRSVVDRMTSSDVIAYADLQKKSITGAIDIQIELPDSLTILEKEPSMMMVELENIITVQKEVQPYMEGEPGEGYVYLDPVVTPNNIEVEGPESKIALIKSVLVPVNIEGVTRDVTLYGTPQIIDDSNNIINGISKSSNQVQIQVPIEKLRTLQIKKDFEETIAEGYELINITLSQDSLQVRGKASLIDKAEPILIQNIDVSTLTEDTIISVNIEDLLVSGLNIYSDSTVIELYVDIEPIETKIIEINQNNINVRQLASDMQFGNLEEEPFSLEFSGIASKLDTLTLETLMPSISLFDLDEGLHEIELDLFIPIGVELISPKPIVTIELAKIVGSTPNSGQGNTTPGTTSP